MNLRQRYRRAGTLKWSYIIGFDSLRRYVPYLYSDFLSKWTRGKCQAGKRVWFVLLCGMRITKSLEAFMYYTRGLYFGRGKMDLRLPKGCLMWPLGSSWWPVGRLGWKLGRLRGTFGHISLEEFNWNVFWDTALYAYPLNKTYSIDNRFSESSSDNREQLREFWFFKGLKGIRKPVGTVKAPTGPLTPWSEATNILDKWDEKG